MYLKKETSGYGVPIFQTVLETAQGGFTLETAAFTEGEVLKAGTPIGATVANETARRVTAIKTAKVYEAATNTATELKVEKGHNFKVGEYLAAVKGGKAYAITVVDKTNAAYDVLTVGTTLAVALAVGDALFLSTATGASAAAYVRPIGLLYEDTVIKLEKSVDIVIRGTVYARRVSVVSEIRAELPNIIFSNSY